MARGLASSEATLGVAYRSTPLTSSNGREADNQCCHLFLLDSFSLAVDAQNQVLSRDIYITTDNKKYSPAVYVRVAGGAYSEYIAIFESLTADVHVASLRLRRNVVVVEGFQLIAADKQLLFRFKLT